MQIIVKSKKSEIIKSLYLSGFNKWDNWKTYLQNLQSDDSPHEYILASTLYRSFCRVSKIPEGENVLYCGEDEFRFLKEIKQWE